MAIGKSLIKLIRYGTKSAKKRYPQYQELGKAIRKKKVRARKFIDKQLAESGTTTKQIGKEFRTLGKSLKPYLLGPEKKKRVVRKARRAIKRGTKKMMKRRR